MSNEVRRLKRKSKSKIYRLLRSCKYTLLLNEICTLVIFVSTLVAIAMATKQELVHFTVFMIFSCMLLSVLISYATYANIVEYQSTRKRKPKTTLIPIPIPILKEEEKVQ